MITTAASWYTCCQNSPSDPFLLELDVPEQPTREDIEAFLTPLVNTNDYEEEGDPDELVVPRFAYGLRASYGDISVTHDDDSWLFVTLPRALAESLGIRKDGLPV